MNSNFYNSKRSDLIKQSGLSPEQLSNCLKPKTTLKDEYVIDHVISINSEGIIYLAYDKNFDKKFFIKEFAPLSLSKRQPGQALLLPSHQREAQYKALMVDFIDLYKTLHGLSNVQGILPVIDIFQENNTVYAVKEYIELISLRSYLDIFSNKTLSWYKCKSIFIKINDILSSIHKHDLIHRGICPYNIYFDKFKKIYIDGFTISCVRTAQSELDDELYEGFSAPEQYQTDGWQGTWTDVYGIASTLFNVLTGKTLSRGRQNLNTPEIKAMMPEQVLVAIENATIYNYKDRTRTIDQFNLDLLDDTFVGSTAVYDTSNLKKQQTFKVDQEISSKPKDNNKNKSNKNKAKIFIYLSLALTFIMLTVLGINIFRSITQSTSKTEKIEDKYIEKNSWLFDESVTSNPSKDSLSLGESKKPSVTDPIKILPNFVGEQISDVTKNKAYLAKLKFTVEEEYSESNPGEIIHQDPLPGISLTSKIDVILKVSKGPEYIEVPNIVGLPIEEAENILKEQEIKYDIFEVYDPSYKEGIINSMDREPGEKIIKSQDTIILRIKSSALKESENKENKDNEQKNTSKNKSSSSKPDQHEE